MKKSVSFSLFSLDNMVCHSPLDRGDGGDLLCGRWYHARLPDKGRA